LLAQEISGEGTQTIICPGNAAKPKHLPPSPENQSWAARFWD